MNIKKKEEKAIESLRKAKYRDYKKVGVRDYFNEIEPDGVFMKGKGLVVVEAYMGGKRKRKMRNASIDKMLKDSFKMLAAEHFLRKKEFTIEKRILLVINKRVHDELVNGWRGIALKQLGIEVAIYGDLYT